MLTVIGDMPTAVNVAPSSVLEEIAQNVRTILTTYRGTVPLDRRFGVDGEFIDEPTPVAISRLSGDIVAAIEQYEPRVRVKSVNFVMSDLVTGRIVPQVKLAIREGVTL